MAPLGRGKSIKGGAFAQRRWRPLSSVWERGLQKIWCEWIGVSQESENARVAIDQTAETLRESIEQAKRLAERSDDLLRKHRKKLAEQAAAAEREAYLRDHPT